MDASPQELKDKGLSALEIVKAVEQTDPQVGQLMVAEPPLGPLA
jgi:hypothetical protein